MPRRDSSGTPPVAQLFIAYSRDDRRHIEALVKHLAPLTREGLLRVWHDGDIKPGEDWNQAITASLSAADIIVILVSASFISSYQCYDVELAKAMKRHEEKSAVLIPVVVGKCLWENLPLRRLQALPTDAKPVHSWADEDDAWTNVVSGIREIALRLRREAASGRKGGSAEATATEPKGRRPRAALWMGGAALGVALTGAATLQPWPVRSRCPPNMAYIAGGTFRMGSEDYDKDAAADERPAHDVTLSAFCIDITEVTVESYRQCTTETRSGTRCVPVPRITQWDHADLKFWGQLCNGERADRDDHPINCVDWRTADTYCRWAGGALPTEAQWEHAARGTERRRYPWGDEPPGLGLLNACGGECRDMARDLGRTVPVMYQGDDGAGTTAPVKSYPKGATPEGVFDMAGNVAEWARDTKMAYEPTPATEPLQSAGKLRVLRGGGWSNPTPRSVRAAAREGLGDDYHLNNVGFRCVRAPDQ